MLCSTGGVCRRHATSGLIKLSNCDIFSHMNIESSLLVAPESLISAMCTSKLCLVCVGSRSVRGDIGVKLAEYRPAASHVCPRIENTHTAEFDYVDIKQQMWRNLWQLASCSFDEENSFFSLFMKKTHFLLMHGENSFSPHS